jgi:hypothetical protein
MYGHMTHWLSSLANGRVILTLEGGYNVNSIAYAMTMCTKTLLGDPLMPLEPCQVACPSAITSINNVLQTHKNFWPNLVFQKSLPLENVLPTAKVPRTKPIERFSSQDNLPKPALSDKVKVEGEPDEKQQEPPRSADQVAQLEIDLENLKIKGCVNNDGDKQSGFDDKLDAPAASSSSAGQQPTSSQDSNKTSLFHYLQDNLQVVIGCFWSNI